jgi:hypothetical protein
LEFQEQQIHENSPQFYRTGSNQPYQHPENVS